MSKYDIIKRWEYQPGTEYSSDSPLHGSAIRTGTIPPTAVSGGEVSEGPGIDVVSTTTGKTVGLGGDTILLYDSGGNPVREYAATSAGLDSATAAAASGDVIWIPACEISGDHTLAAGVEYVGLGRAKTILTGQITMGASSVLSTLTVSRTGSSTTIGVLGPASGKAYVYNCDLVVNVTAGTPLCADAQVADSLYLLFCRIDGQINGVSALPLKRVATTLIDYFTIPANTNSYTTGNTSTSIGTSYTVTVQGQYQFFPSANENAYRDPHWETGCNWCNYASPAFGNPLKFSDGTSPDPENTTFNWEHRYSWTRAGTGSPVSLAIYDDYPADNVGDDLTVEVYQDAEVGSENDVPNVYACQFQCDLIGGYADWGDRAVWDAVNFPGRHSSDINDASHHYHTPYSVYDKAAAPTTGDDNLDGYEIGSRWLDATNNKEYICLDPSTGAAVWTETTVSGGDAADVTYTPAAASDWDGDADPGNVDGALDQLAERVDDLEGATLADHDHSGDAGDGGQFALTNLTSTGASADDVPIADGAGGIAWGAQGGGGSLTVQEIDGTPSISNVTTIRVTNGTATDDGGGQVTLEFGSAATDGAAIHDNVDGEIHAITEKATPVDADEIIIEDSAASYAKKRVQIGNLPAGGGGSAAVADQALTGTNVTAGGTLGTHTGLLSLTLTDAPAGVYALDGRWYISSYNPGSTKFQYSTDGSTWTNVDSSAAPTHNIGGPWRHHFGLYEHSAAGTIHFRIAHYSEGNNVTYGYANDARWGIHLRAMRIGDVPT